MNTNNNKTDLNFFEDIQQKRYTGLIKKIKKSDLRNRYLMNIAMWTYFIIILYRIIYNILNYKSLTNAFQLISEIMIIIGCGLLLVVFLKSYRKYKNIDYSLSVFEILSNSVERYKFSFNMIKPLLLPSFVIGLGVSISHIDFSSYFYIYTALFILLIFTLLFLFAILIGFICWLIIDKPLYSKAKEMLTDLEGI